ncbi:LLM class flavin-dependent oxidoreductase [Actinoplanes sp. NPDC026619]|uniref:LLM class flavin-dependent oxidoreductase n=1 Tax=Actinoplanes sp. NPDC026619 TaxID=3155798 RepID=UPI0033C763D3
MTVEFAGMIGTRDVSETRTPSGPPVDPAYVRRFARAHEEAGFDRILVAYSSASPDATQVAAYAAAATEHIGLLIAHRPGFVFPTTAARIFATLDQLTGGRVAVHTITGGSDAEQRRDGDYLTKDDRYARTEEYLTILRRAWSSPEPFSHEGRFYKFEDFSLLAQPAHRIPLYFGGSSPAAYRVGGAQADVFALWGEPLKETAEQIASVQQAAAAAGRGPLGISVSFRPARSGRLRPRPAARRATRPRWSARRRRSLRRSWITSTSA